MNLRVERLNSEIAKALSQIFRDVKNPKVSGIISVTDVSVTKDFSFVDVCVSVMGANIDVVLEGLEASKGFIRKELARFIGNIHQIPEPRFKKDLRKTHESRIDELLNQIKDEQK